MRPQVEQQQTVPQSILGFGIAKLNAEHEGLNVVDTNVLVNDPNAVDLLKKGGKKGVVFPWIVLSELDVLKNEQDLSRLVMEAIRKINRMQHSKDPNFYIAQGDISEWSDLNPDNPDHHIIALCLTLKKQYPQMPLTLISNDAMVHTVAMRFDINVEEYKADQVDKVDFERPLPKVPMAELKQRDDSNYRIIGGMAASVLPNCGAVITDEDGMPLFAAMRKNNHFVPIKPDIRSMGISSFSIDNEPNWAQMVALQQLLDPTISLVTLHGEAGTGKTLLSIAAALNQLKIDDDDEEKTEPKKPEKHKRAQGQAGNNRFDHVQVAPSYHDVSRRRYRKIYIARPYVHLGNKDTMGFLPGDIRVKSIPWLAPIFDNIDFISSRSESNTRLMERIKQNDSSSMEILPLSFIRGRTLAGAFVVIDEAQNLTRADMKTIVTRAGEDTKIVLVGDINQIDIRWIDKRSSGLTHVTAKMGHLPYFANTFLDKSVRSQMAKDAAELL